LDVARVLAIELKWWGRRVQIEDQAVGEVVKMSDEQVELTWSFDEFSCQAFWYHLELTLIE
jgi:hypothetical protein